MSEDVIEVNGDYIPTEEELEEYKNRDPNSGVEKMIRFLREFSKESSTIEE